MNKKVHLTDKAIIFREELYYTQLPLPWISFVTVNTLNLSLSVIQSKDWKPSMPSKLNWIWHLKLSKITQAS